MSEDWAANDKKGHAWPRVTAATLTRVSRSHPGDERQLKLAKNMTRIKNGAVVYFMLTERRKKNRICGGLFLTDLFIE